MESLRALYKAGYGPSSSHTVAPMRAARMFQQQTPEAHAYLVEFYGSLALTGKGHFSLLARDVRYDVGECFVRFKP